MLLNGDATTVDNINADGATISKTDAGKGHWLLGFDGLIHLPLVDNTSQANNHGADVDDDMFNEIRGKLGRYGRTSLGAGLHHGCKHLHTLSQREQFQDPR